MSGLTPTGFVAATTTDVQTKIENDELALIDPALNLSPVQPLGQLNGIFASAAANLWALIAAIYTAIDPNGAVGVQLDNLCAITGCTRLSATKTLVNATVNLNASQSFAPGALTANIVGYPQYTFTNRDQVTSTGAGNYAAVFQATSTGPIVCNAGTLVVISPPVSGWNSITNVTSGTVGTNVETDAALRLRRAALIVSAGGCTIDSIRSSLLNPTLVPGIIQATVIENNTSQPDQYNQPGKSFQALIWDGPSPVADNTKIAQAIWNSKPAGVQAFGQTTVNATDQTGKLQPVSFTRVSQLRIYFALTVLTNPLLFPSTGIAMIQAAMVALTVAPSSDGYFLGPGINVIKAQMQAAALSVLGVIDVTVFTLDITPAPVATANILVSPFQIATVSSGDIAVTVT